MIVLFLFVTQWGISITHSNVCRFFKSRAASSFTSFLPRKRSHRAFPFSKDDVQQYHVVVLVLVLVVLVLAAAAAVAVIVAERRERYTSSEKKNVE